MARSNPFPGLLPFREEDAAFFFGRDKEIDEVLGRLTSRRLLAVIGISGCGKSSLVAAGVIPVLRMGAPAPLAGRWRISVLNPGSSPLRALAASMGVSGEWPRNTFDLTDRARELLQPGEALLLVIDQFEELFRFRRATLAKDGGNAASLFVNVLLHAVQQREVPVYVLLTMRTDYVGDCSLFRGLPEALNDCYYLVPGMTRLQKQEAIENPVKQQGITMHPALTQRLLNDSADDPNQLPVLQHVLRRLWERWSERNSSEAIGLDDYEAVGRWADALNRDAESTLALFESCGDGIRRLFQWITELGPAGQPVRRPESLSDCGLATGLQAEVLGDIVAAFEGRGLLRCSSQGDTCFVDLPHESVALHWARLRRWVAEEGENAIQIRFFLHAARQRMPLTELALEAGLRLRASWREHPVRPLRYLSAAELDEAIAWITRSEDLDKSRRDLAAARELCAWAALSLRDDPERSLILGLLAWGKQRAMLPGLEEFLHLALQHSYSRALLNQNGSVWALAWSPDDRKLAAAGSDQTVTIWNAETGTAMLSLTGHQGSVLDAVWSPDGTRLASTGSDGTLKLWNTDSGTLASELRVHDYAVLSIHWSPDGTRIATASDDNTAKLWDSSTGREILALHGHAGAVWCIRWSPDGRTLATASRDATAKLWDATDGRELLTLRGHQSVVKSVAWSPDGARVATGSFDATVKVWDAGTGFELFTLSSHLGPVLGVAWLSATNKLATCSFDNTARIWDGDTGQEVAVLRGYEAPVISVAASHAGRLVATGTDHGAVRIAEIGSRELLSFRAHRLIAWQIRWCPDGTRLATSSDEQAIAIWDADTGAAVKAIACEGTHVESLAWSPDGALLLTSGLAGATIRDAATGRTVLAIGGHEDYVGSVAWSPDGHKVATGSRDGVLKISDATTGAELLTIRAHEGDVRAIAWSADGTLLSSVSSDGLIRISDCRTGEPVSTIRYPDAVTSASWPGDVTKLATASRDRRGTVWDVASGREAACLSGHAAAVQCVAWSPDSRTIATGGWDYTIRIWAPNDGRELLTLRTESPVQSIAWSPDGTRLAAVGLDGMAAVYAIDQTLLVRLVRSRITRQLTRDECRRYLGVEVCPPLPDV